MLLLDDTGTTRRTFASSRPPTRSDASQLGEWSVVACGERALVSARVQMGEHSEHAPVTVFALGDVELRSTWRTCASTVRSERKSRLAIPELVSPSAMSSSTSRSRSESSDRVRSPAEQPPDDLGVERRAAARHALGRFEELADRQHAVLEQVAEAAERDEFHGMRGLDVLGEDEHADGGVRALDLRAPLARPRR